MVFIGQGQFGAQNQRQNNFGGDTSFVRRDKAPGDFYNNRNGGPDNRNSYGNAGGGGGNPRNLFDRNEPNLIPRDRNPFAMNRGSGDNSGGLNWQTRSSASPQRGGQGTICLWISLVFDTGSTNESGCEITILTDLVTGGQWRNDDGNRSQQYNDGGNRGNNQGMNMGGGNQGGNQPVMIIPSNTGNVSYLQLVSN